MRARLRPHSSTFIAAALALPISACCSSSDGTDLDNPRLIQFYDDTLVGLGERVSTGATTGPSGVGNGASIGDVDGDGDLDVVLGRVSRAGASSGGPTQLFLNDSFEGDFFLYPDPSFPALTTNLVVYATALGDYDADGDLDLFLGCAGPDHLLENDGHGRFTDVSARAGIAGDLADLTTGGVFADLNNDGLLDLYVTDYLEKNRLFLNLGNGTFADVSEASGVADAGQSRTAAVADLDNDGRLDIYVGNDILASDDVPSAQILPKDALFARVELDDLGVPHFLDVAQTSGVQGNRNTSGVALADFSGDSYLDVYVTDAGASELYVFDPVTGRFTNRAREMHVDLRYTTSPGERELFVGWGAVVTDLDRDGSLELFVAHGEPAAPGEGADRQIDSFLRQPARGLPFVDITGSANLPTSAEETPRADRGAYKGDLDRDGDDDLLVGAFDGSFRVYRNETPATGHHFVRLRLRGTVSAPDPVGAIVTVQSSDGAQRLGWRTSGGDTYGSSDGVVEVATGSAMPTYVDVQWPSGLVERVEDFGPDREVVVEEPRWLELSARNVDDRAPAPRLTYRPRDGRPGHNVQVTTTDGRSFTAAEGEDDTGSTYTVDLPHVGVARRTVITLVVDGEQLAIRPMIVYR